MQKFSIAFVVPFFGEWPVWFPAFLTSCKYNPDITWMFFTDCDCSIEKPDNVQFYPSSLDTLKNKISSVVGFEVGLNNAYKVCDFRPAFGEVFKEHLQDYDFWWYCDVDIVWGDIRKFITYRRLNEYEIITSLESLIAGHFTLFKNNDEINRLYKLQDVYQNVFKDTRYCRFDEYGFTELLLQNQLTKGIHILWDKISLAEGIKAVNHQEYDLDAWKYEDGKLYDYSQGICGKEYLYLHFINWKPKLKVCELEYGHDKREFYISYSKIHFEEHSKLQYLANAIKNRLNGYWVKENRRLRNRKLRSLMKRLKEKIKSYFN
ncbi:hypothetical protein LRR18_06505 [Mangrovimonas sp. AS39]|uniref:DUF6625 family protein n=1 Tax=Mangrovimonas futianensis TaxID=2895523 RepID=UPI001E2C7748|nr:DUF6625 family protein [Mangrovimonas futianensis]MCF1191233.1 hypothetical protein [Mangrovimonas futianensis]MCF1194928.1 hypothetical protein [Mangrovimonas futianensis]